MDIDDHHTVGGVGLQRNFHFLIIVQSGGDRHAVTRQADHGDYNPNDVQMGDDDDEFDRGSSINHFPSDLPMQDEEAGREDHHSEVSLELGGPLGEYPDQGYDGGLEEDVSEGGEDSQGFAIDVRIVAPTLILAYINVGR